MEYNLIMSPPEEGLAESPRAAIRQSKSLKEAAQEERLGLKGNLGFELRAIMPHVFEVASVLESQHPEFIESQRKRFKEYLGDIPEDRVREIYEGGLSVFFKQQYRLFKKINPDEVDKLKDDKYLKDGVIAYTFDFFQSLRIVQVLDIAPRTGLDLAQKAYRVNPTTVLRLIDQFPEISPWITVRAITQHSNPEDYLRKIQATVEDLKPRFSQFSSSDLTRAAMQRPDNTESFLRDAWAKVEDMKTRFSDFSQPILINAVLRHPSDPEGFLARTRNFLDTLTHEFPEFSKRNLLEVAIRYENPGEFLSHIHDRVNDLANQFPEFYKTLIARAVLDNKKPEKFLLNIRATVERLTTTFPQFNKTDIAQVAFTHTSNPEDFLRNAQKVIEQLTQEFPESDKSAIRRAALFYPSDPREGLKHYENKKVA